MAIACLYSHRISPDDEHDTLWSFAFITTELPPEVAVVGHDRCIMPIKPEHIDRWLQPAPGDLAHFYEILDDRERPYFHHAVAKGLGEDRAGRPAHADSGPAERRLVLKPIRVRKQIFYVGHEVADFALQGDGELHQGPDRWSSLSRLDQPNVGAIEGDGIRQLVLAEPAL